MYGTSSEGNIYYFMTQNWCYMKQYIQQLFLVILLCLHSWNLKTNDLKNIFLMNESIMSRDVNFSWVKYGRNDSLCSFLLTSVTTWGPLLGVRWRKTFSFSKIFFPENGVLECNYYLFCINNFINAVKKTLFWHN